MLMFLTIFLWLIMGAACSYYAQLRGRDPITWFFLGMLLGIIGLLVLFYLPSIEKTNQPDIDVLEEPFPEHASMNIRFKDWYYIDEDDKQKGPIPYTTLERLYHNGALRLSTFVWSEGMEGWSQLQDTNDLKSVFEK